MIDLDKELCPVCRDPSSTNVDVSKDSCRNHQINSQCREWFCRGCIQHLHNNLIHICPLCRVNIKELVELYREA
jgi:hypothetical protein